MSNAGQVGLGIVGGIAGFFLGGGPAGAAYGFQLGLAVGTVVSPTQLPGTFGPRLSDNRTTTAQLGAPIVELWGTDAVAGTVIWLGDVVEHATTEEVGGKGGPEGENTTFSYTQSIAVGLCRGPQAGVRRIWENGKLVYDVRGQLPDETLNDFSVRISASAEYALNFVLYLGDEDQLPDPTLELKEGLGNVPAYRGLMYIVYPDRLLRDDQALRHPNFKFEIAAASIPAPDLRQADEETLRSSFIVSTGASAGSGNNVGFSDIPFFSFGDCFSAQIVGAPGTVEIVGGFEVPVAYCAFGGVVFPPLGFSLEIHDFFYRLVTQVEFAGPDFLGTPTIFINPSGNSTFRRLGDARTVLEFYPTAQTPFIAGFDYLVTVTSTLPAGRLSFCELTAATVSPLGAPIIGFNSGAYSSSIGAFGSFTGTVDVGEEAEADVLGFYLETAGSNPQLCLVLNGVFPTLQVVVTLTGENGNVIFGPFDGTTPGTGITQFTWEAEASMLAAPNTYAVVVRGVGVVPFVGVDENPPVSLATIVADICERCGLTDIDVSDLEEPTVSGYQVSRVMDGRSAIAVLRQVGFFDAVESAGIAKFPTRGKAPVRTLELADLGAHAADSAVPPSVTTRSQQDLELPRQLFIQYRDPDRDYEQGQQASPTRLITDAVNDSYVDVAVAIDATAAAKIAEVLWADQWAARWQHSLSVDASHTDLEPTDCVLVPVDGRLERMRIVSAEVSAIVLRQFALVRDDDGSYVSAAIADAPAVVPNVLRLYATTTLTLLDLPPLRVEDNDAGVYAATARSGSGTSWPGAGLYRGEVGGPLSALVSVTSEALVGTLVSGLPAGPSTIWDEGNVLVVDLPRGQFESRTEAEVLDGANTLAIGAHGRWELVSFATATQVGSTQWRLTQLLRGRRGTEHAIGGSLTGDTAVLVSGAGIVRLPLLTAELGVPFVYRAVTIGAALGTGADQTFTGAGEALVPFAPVHAMADQDSGDITLSWVRRDRLLLDYVVGVATPMSEASEAYEVDILDGDSPPAVLRTLTSSTASVLYTAAQQSTDFGSPIPTALTVRIYQLGALGRGHVCEESV